jgi:hypothetical protein
MSERPQRLARDERRIVEWLFLLLRFAITRDPIDRAAALAAAMPLDEAATPHVRTFAYFARTTGQICAAIIGVRDEHACSMLQNFLERIDDERLRAAFSACLDLQVAPSRVPQRATWRDRHDLWRGLSKR